MATSLCSALAVVVLLQAPALSPAPDSLALLHARVDRDSSDAAAWLLLGRAYLRQADGARDPGQPPAADDSATTRALLDTADRALVPAPPPPGPPGPRPPGHSPPALPPAPADPRAPPPPPPPR